MTDGRELAPLDCWNGLVMASGALARRTEPPVLRARNTSATPLESPDTRVDALEVKATHSPEGLMADSELAPLEREVARELLDRHRSALYYG